MKTPALKSTLPQAFGELIEFCQRADHADIFDLQIRGGQPVFEPPPRTILKRKLGQESGPRPELALRDFLLKTQVLDLIKLITEIRDGEIKRIELRHGLPFLVEFEAPVVGAGGTPK